MIGEYERKAEKRYKIVESSFVAVFYFKKEFHIQL